MSWARRNSTRPPVTPVAHPAARSRSILAALLAAVALSGAIAVGGCGDGTGGGSTDDTPSPTSSPSTGSDTVLVVVPDTGFQQTEYQAVAGALREAGYSTQVANALGGDSVSGDVHVRSDLMIADADAADYAGVVLIGGPGTISLFDDGDLEGLVRAAHEQGEVVAAICLAPVILARAGLLESREATVWHENAADLEAAGCSVQDGPVVVDGTIVTGNGPDAAQEFAAAVIEQLDAQR